MKKSEFTDQQIAFAVQQAEAGVAVEEVCRKLGDQPADFIHRSTAGAASDFGVFGCRSTMTGIR